MSGAVMVAMALVSMALVSVVPAALTAAPLDVVGSTGVELEVRTEGRLVEVQGTLRDNVAQGVPYRDVVLRWAGPSEVVDRLVVQTDRLGRFRHRRVVAEGSWTIEASFDGDPWLDSARTSRAVGVRRGSVALSLVAPPIAPDAWREVPFEVTASGAAGALPVEVRATCGGAPSGAVEVRTTGATSTGGTLPALPTGTCMLSARFAGDERYEAAMVTREVLRGTPGVSIGRVTAPKVPSGDWLVEVVVSVDGVPSESPPPTLRVDGTPVVAAKAEGTGVGGWRFSLPPRWVGGGGSALVAEVTLSFPGRDGIVVRSEAVMASPPRDAATRVSEVAGAAAVVLGLVAVAWVLRERWRARPRRERAGGPRAPLPPVSEEEESVDGVPAAAGPGRWRLVLRDAETGEALSGRVRVARAADGEPVGEVREGGQAWYAEPTGTELTIEADVDGYEPFRARGRAPAAGRRMVLGLVSWRAKVRDVLRGLDDVAPGALPVASWWGRITPPEAGDRLARSIQRLRHARDEGESAMLRLRALLDEVEGSPAPAPAAAVEALGLLVDEVYFRPGPCGRETWELAVRLAGAVRSARADAVEGATAEDGPAEGAPAEDAGEEIGAAAGAKSAGADASSVEGAASKEGVP